MKVGLLPLLASPCCGASLRFSALSDTPLGTSAEVADGRLACGSCGTEWELRGGVPRLSEGLRDSRAARTRDSFAWEWLRYPGSLPEDREVFLEEAQLSAEAFRDKLVLDAGCGMGRYSVAALQLGAEVVSLDLSDSLERVAEIAPRWPGLHAVQGDLLKPPLKHSSFDVVFSHGVLHHTADTRAAFEQLAALVKPGGYLSVWLYGRAGRYRDFATNPLRPGREWVGRHRRLAWAIVGLRHLVSDAVRLFTTRLPLRVTYWLCYPLALLGLVPGLKYLTFSVHPRFKVRVIENFDWISPPYQRHHTKEELAAWFDACGFDVVKVLPHGLVPKPGILGRKRL